MPIIKTMLKLINPIYYFFVEIAQRHIFFLIDFKLRLELITKEENGFRVDCSKSHAMIIYASVRARTSSSTFILLNF